MTKSLYDQYPDGMKFLAARDCSEIVEMSRHFTKQTEMGIALGFHDSGSGVGKWLRGESLPSKPSKQSARNWLDARIAMPAPLPIATSVMATPAPIEKPQGVVLMVVCAGDTAARAQKVLAMLGCEVVEV